ncbi:uncharacterized protein L969DRAFT_15173 [Mixia osmundae IAM 14324]|uniref:Uncharacterized protein n=1 Tax=Mixia osmundae (strain CBS 9802 / IAM 14324 / JCM 22182 / KY 12970) TaxID=764103 RepID=G7DXP5_MIXOS|nr:uncharacterized protein L969DRAFT_15173 [Mixia osmundae IAM 14324]KEI41154.1 hypothetical protein L969DRAFT_15173 [Mixia osmundae IAM 14324]GAA95355.1 hypothetical protein E5Q_02012 [Mixia osmundae IAM 14324]
MSRPALNDAQTNLMFETLHSLLEAEGTGILTAAIIDQAEAQLKALPEFDDFVFNDCSIRSKVKPCKDVYNAVKRLSQLCDYTIFTGSDLSDQIFEELCDRTCRNKAIASEVKRAGLGSPWIAIWDRLSAYCELQDRLRHTTDTDKQNDQAKQSDLVECGGCGATTARKRRSSVTHSPRKLVKLKPWDATSSTPVKSATIVPTLLHSPPSNAELLASKALPSLGALEQFGYVMSHISQFEQVKTYLDIGVFAKLHVLAILNEEIAKTLIPLLDLGDPVRIIVCLEALMQVDAHAELTS